MVIISVGRPSRLSSSMRFEIFLFVRQQRLCTNHRVAASYVLCALCYEKRRDVHVVFTKTTRSGSGPTVTKVRSSRKGLESASRNALNASAFLWRRFGNRSSVDPLVVWTNWTCLVHVGVQRSGYELAYWTNVAHDNSSTR